MFYISVDNTIQELTNDNNSNTWVPGPINNLKLNTMDDPHVGLQACWNGSSTPSESTDSIYLWYAKDSTTFGFASWSVGDSTWRQEKDFDDYNGHGGVACYSQYSPYIAPQNSTYGPDTPDSPYGPDPQYSQEGGNTTYVMFVSLQNEINILWKDVNTTLKDGWTNSGFLSVCPARAQLMI